MKNKTTSVAGALVLMWTGAALAQEMKSRTIPSRVIPVPNTVSYEMQKAIAQPDRVLSTDPDDWMAEEAARQTHDPDKLAVIGDQYGVSVERQVIGGVPCYTATPKVLTRRNRRRLIISLHAGGYVSGGGESVASYAAAWVAALTGVTTLAIDYRLAPTHPFPAAMDDAIAVWRDVVKRNKPSRIGYFGFSAGGGMVLALAQRAQKEGLPLPAAIVSATPFSDLSKTGDSYFTNAGLDNQLPSYEGYVEATAKAYANGRDLKDPLLSPVYGDFAGFPPTFLLTGTRDLFLSNTVRVQQKLRQAGVEAQLEVYEGGSHGQFGLFGAPGTPEESQFNRGVSEFLDAHLSR